MKWALIFSFLTILCWGTYVPTIHQGAKGFGAGNGQLRAFLFVAAAYGMWAIVVLAYLAITKAEPMTFASAGVSYSTLAGIVGAGGALGIIFAMKSGGPRSAIWVAPLVFAGAPIVNTIVSMIWHRPSETPRIWFFVGILMAAGGATMALRFKPS